MNDNEENDRSLYIGPFDKTDKKIPPKIRLLPQKHTGTFVIMNYPSWSLIILFDLKLILSNINRVIAAFLFCYISQHVILKQQ